MRKPLAALAGMLIAGALLAAPVTAAEVTPAKTDWSRVVDFSKTGLDRFDPADAALLKMLSPERILDSADRARFQRQLDSLVAAQSWPGRTAQPSSRSLASPHPLPSPPSTPAVSSPARIRAAMTCVATTRPATG